LGAERVVNRGFILLHKPIVGTTPLPRPAGSPERPWWRPGWAFADRQGRWRWLYCHVEADGLGTPSALLAGGHLAVGSGRNARRNKELKAPGPRSPALLLKHPTSSLSLAAQPPRLVVVHLAIGIRTAQLRRPLCCKGPFSTYQRLIGPPTPATIAQHQSCAAGRSDSRRRS
jgi:hypothetical protein